MNIEGHKNDVVFMPLMATTSICVISPTISNGIVLLYTLTGVVYSLKFPIDSPSSPKHGRLNDAVRLFLIPYRLLELRHDIRRKILFAGLYIDPRRDILDRVAPTTNLTSWTGAIGLAGRVLPPLCNLQ